VSISVLLSLAIFAQLTATCAPQVASETLAAVFSEIMRVLRPGGRLQFADIANGKPVPEAAIRNIDLWTD
jgi:SAM-dependent methyltransferase